MHEHGEATQTQNILRYRRLCQAADKQAYMQHVHAQTETLTAIRSRRNQSQQMCEVLKVDTGREKIKEE